jgi:hypothetical protein
VTTPGVWVRKHPLTAGLSPCPRQESNLDLPLRRLNRAAVSKTGFIGRRRRFGPMPPDLDRAGLGATRRRLGSRIGLPPKTAGGPAGVRRGADHDKIDAHPRRIGPRRAVFVDGGHKAARAGENGSATAANRCCGTSSRACELLLRLQRVYGRYRLHTTPLKQHSCRSRAAGEHRGARSVVRGEYPAVRCGVRRSKRAPVMGGDRIQDATASNPPPPRVVLDLPLPRHFVFTLPLFRRFDGTIGVGVFALLL